MRRVRAAIILLGPLILAAPLRAQSPAEDPYLTLAKAIEASARAGEAGFFERALDLDALSQAAFHSDTRHPADLEAGMTTFDRGGLRRATRHCSFD